MFTLTMWYMMVMVLCMGLTYLTMRGSDVDLPNHINCKVYNLREFRENQKKNKEHKAA